MSEQQSFSIQKDFIIANFPQACKERAFFRQFQQESSGKIHAFFRKTSCKGRVKMIE
jgi:hypothetical protein